ncbi:MAG: GNAT family N-acetyltransferase [Lachnospiraceae bacterium]|nr:GNAT family N-acetyltransferase [Lachnospiraceae bacterium]
MDIYNGEGTGSCDEKYGEKQMSTDKVYLRPITAADTAKIVAWRNKDFVRGNFVYQKLFTEEGHMTWLREQVEPGHVAQFIICVKETDTGWAEECQAGTEYFCREIGSVYLRDIDREKKTAEYGIFIGEENVLGHGYGVQAATLMLEYGFETLHLEKVFLRVLEDNAVARKSYTKAGFQLIEGRKESVKLEQGVRNILFMEITRRTWERAKTIPPST